MTMTVAAPTPNRTAPFVKHLKDSDQDFEWYPTTDAMIAAIKADLDKNYSSNPTVLDCGAGDGRLLRALTKSDKFAIEKSKPLLSSIKHDIYIVGTDFHQQTLIDKSVDAVTSNPPYSEFELWAAKIIKEANAQVVYLVMPKRWEQSSIIKDAIELRNVDSKIIFEGDFLEADRRARAKVHVVKFLTGGCPDDRYLRPLERRKANAPRNPKSAFALWFDEHFKINARKDELSEWARKEQQKDELQKNLNTTDLVEKKGVIEALVQFYHHDLDKLMATYTSLADLDADLLAEMDVNLDGVKKALRERVKGLKHIYWTELFDRLKSVTDRLTYHSRQSLLERLMSQTSVDFSADNAHAIALWVVKNANMYLEDQLVKTFELMLERANIVTYKSNQKTFGDEKWRYNGRYDGELTHVKLDYRIVLEGVGGLALDWYDNRVKGLSERASRFLDDLATVAHNIGFTTQGMPRAADMTWDSNIKNEFQYRDLKTGKLQTLFEAKAFKKGTVHLKMRPEFICALNCEFGRLKGWLKTREQAADELDIDVTDTTAFGVNLQLAAKDLTPRLGFSAAA